MAGPDPQANMLAEAPPPRGWQVIPERIMAMQGECM
jgi:hypothetical protein